MASFRSPAFSSAARGISQLGSGAVIADRFIKKKTHIMARLNSSRVVNIGDLRTVAKSRVPTLSPRTQSHFSVAEITDLFQRRNSDRLFVRGIDVVPDFLLLRKPYTTQHS